MVLAKREEINKKQNQLAKMMAVDAQNRLKKASAEVTKLTGELKTCKADDYFGAKESPFDFLTNEEVGGRPDSLENALDNNKGRHKSFGIPMTTVPGARVVHDIPVLRKRHETERAEGFSSISETVHPFYMSAEEEQGFFSRTIGRWFRF
ncbi:hypothetical protein ACROYT_G040214 [Oculina patagonica]